MLRFEAPRRCLRLVMALAPVLALAACALPRSGPSAADFTRASAERSIDLVEASMQDAAASRAVLPTGFDEAWRAAKPVPVGVIGRGDIVSVALFERDGLNLFPAGTDGASRFDGLLVDGTGAIQLPYVGQVQIAGLTPIQARGAIVARMRRLSVSPDVTVSVSEPRSQLVSVQGDVMKPGVLPIGPETSRLSSLLGTAAPTQANLELATVTVRRGGQSATVRLADLYEQPLDDIALRGGDAVIVRSAPGIVNVLGAAGMQGRVKISRRNYSVMDAVGDARGLDDAAASPAAVYLMRLGNAADANAAVPRVYHFDFRNPAQIAVASAFAVHDGDAVLISNAPFAQSHKVISAFSGVLNTARTASSFAP